MEKKESNIKKLKLDLEDLTVESFETLPDQKENQGTVYGQLTYTDTRVCPTVTNCLSTSCCFGDCTTKPCVE